MTKWLVLAGLAGFGLGLGIGVVVIYLSAVRSLVGGYTRLRYYGFRPEPLPEKPRTVATPPLPTVRED